MADFSVLLEATGPVITSTFTEVNLIIRYSWGGKGKG